MNDNLLNRAQILLEQNRYKEAAEILSNIMESDPDNPHVLAIYSEVLLELDQKTKAEELINSAINLAPDVDQLYYIKARVMLQKDKYDLAEESLNEAIVLDPGNANYYALWASIKLARKKFKEALELADKSLELDAENLLALNTRSTALLKLNKKEESFKTIEGALKEDPNNAYTHSNYGWHELEKGSNKKALEHFSEALKIDPNFGMAQAGMVQALKGKYLFYRLFLKYAFLMSKLSAKYQWGIIIGFYLLYRVLNAIASKNAALQPYITPVLILMAVLAFSTWVIAPLSNLFLRLNVFGRHLLKRKEIISSNFVGISLLVFLGGLVAYLVFKEEKWLALMAFGFAMMVPLSTMLNPTRYKNALLIYTIGLFVLGAFALLITFNTGILFHNLSTYFLFGFIAYQFVANFLMIKEDNI